MPKKVRTRLVKEENSWEMNEKCPNARTYIGYIYDKEFPPAGLEELICFKCLDKYRKFPDQKSKEIAAEFEENNPGLGCHVYFHE